MRGNAKGPIAPPLVCKPYRADYQDSEWKGHQADPQANVRSGGIPVYDALCRVRGFVLQGLHAAYEQRGHEQDSGEYKQQFQSGEGAAIRLHELTLYHKVQFANQ